MNMFEFAIASIVDANTGNGLPHINGSRDYAAAERHGRKIRSKSIVDRFTQIRSRSTAAFNSYRTKARQDRDLRQLMSLCDHLLEDIGIHRGDLHALQLGITTFDELNGSRQSVNHGKLAKLGYVTADERTSGNLDASNEPFFDQKKCA